MAIYDILTTHKDQRDGGDICSFNGYLEDYLGMIEEDETKTREAEAFRFLHGLDENLRICTDLHLNINRDAIANQIIRYKDAFKMPDGEICVPYIVYGKDDGGQRASIILFGGREDYVFAKAYYYVISEPDNMYEGTRNEIVSMVCGKTWTTCSVTRWNAISDVRRRLASCSVLRTAACSRTMMR